MIINKMTTSLDLNYLIGTNQSKFVNKVVDTTYKKTLL